MHIIALQQRKTQLTPKGSGKNQVTAQGSRIVFQHGEDLQLQNLYESNLCK